MSSPQLKTKTTSTITKKLLADHAAMNALIDELKPSLQEICRRQASSELKKTQESMQQFVSIMNTHSACEEEAVFPTLTKYHPLSVLEAEHDELLLKRAVLLSGILNYTFPEDCSDKLYKQALEFFDLFQRHMKKEEHVIFPLVESSLSAEEKFMVLTQMEAFQAKARVIPTPEISRPPAEYTRFSFPISGTPVQEIQTRSVLEKDGVKIKTLGLQAGASLAAHWSPQQIIILLYSGNASWSTADTTLSLQAGDGILMDPKLPHALQAETDCLLLLVLNEY